MQSHHFLPSLFLLQNGRRPYTDTDAVAPLLAFAFGDSQSNGGKIADKPDYAAARLVQTRAYPQFSIPLAAAFPSSLRESAGRVSQIQPVF
jgi:hypothetical protein